MSNTTTNNDNDNCNDNSNDNGNNNNNNNNNMAPNEEPDWHDPFVFAHWASPDFNMPPPLSSSSDRVGVHGPWGPLADGGWTPWDHHAMYAMWPGGRRHRGGRRHPGPHIPHRGRPNQEQPADNPGGPEAKDEKAAASSSNSKANHDAGETPKQREKRDSSPDTLRAADDPVPDPDEVAPEDCGDNSNSNNHHHARSHGRRGHGRARRARCANGGFGMGFDNFRRAHGFPPYVPPPPPPPPCPPNPAEGGASRASIDLNAMLRGIFNTDHPFMQNLRGQIEQAIYNNLNPGWNGPNNESNNNNHGNEAGTDNASSSSSMFVPPVDVFNTPSAYVIHVALPGAKKEDIGVNWDPDRGTLGIAGVVHRPGDEQFLQMLSSGERRVGLFDRSIRLPPTAESDPAAKLFAAVGGIGGNGAGVVNDEIDGFAITAKMEDGILVVNVPKVEKEWTEVRKVDVE